MRKFHKRQVLEVIESIHTVHQHCKDQLARQDYQTLQGLLTDCQDAAIQIGELIEQLEGEGTAAVSYLEQYCERLYQVNVQVEKISPQKAFKCLEEILIKAENAINHIKVKKEVVFLPYKASMWDSLESVYLAAREDEDCDAYVVPIPYYEKSASTTVSANCITKGMNILRILRLPIMRIIIWKRDIRMLFIFIIRMTDATLSPACRSGFFAAI